MSVLVLEANVGQAFKRVGQSRREEEEWMAKDAKNMFT